MKFSYNWLKEFIEIPITPQELSDLLLSIGFEVSDIKYENSLDKIKFVKVVSVKKKEDVYICDVNYKDEKYSVVTTVKGIKTNDVLAFAPAGEFLPSNEKIELKKIKGVISEGKFCSEKDLGFGNNEKDIFKGENEYAGKTVGEIMNLNDTILDVSIPPNRHDCLSHLGLAREIFAKLVDIKEFKIPESHLHETKEIDDLEIKIEDPEICQRYIAKIITDLEFKPSNFYYKIRKRLSYCGLNPVEPFVDVANYVMLEIGHSLHVFDLKKIKNRILIRKANIGESIFAFDNKNYTLDEDIPVIADDEKILAIAGIIGSVNSGVDEKTKEVVIESAIFNPISIRKASKKLKLITEASYRFERGSNWYFSELASNRAAYLLSILFFGKLHSQKDIYRELPRKKLIQIDHKEISSFIGMNYDVIEATKILDRLNIITFQKNSTNYLEIPYERLDLNTPADIAEEIARFLDYRNLPSSLNISQLSILDEPQSLDEKIRRFLLAQKLNEVINYGLTSSLWLEKIHLNENTVKVINPVSNLYDTLRPSTLPELLKNFLDNTSNKTKDIKIFEIGKIFIKQNHNIFEKKAVGILCAGFLEPLHWLKKQEKIDLYFLLSIVKGLLAELNVEKYEEKEEKYDFFSRGSIEIKLNGEKIAIIGKLNFDFLNDNVYFAEIYIDPLKTLKEKYYREPPKYPQIIRDISIVVDENIPYRKIEEIILSMTKNYTCQLTLYDLYKSEKIGIGKKSLTMRLEICSYDHTITDEEINDLTSEIIKELGKKCNATLRRRNNE